MKKIVTLIFVAAIFALLAIAAADVSAVNGDAEAPRLEVNIDAGNVSVGKLRDGDENTYVSVPDGTAVTITSAEGISSLYIIFDRVCGEWTLTVHGVDALDPDTANTDGAGECTATVNCGENGFLHEYVDVYGLFGCAPETVTLTFDNGEVSLSEIYAFGDGDLPDWVQVWQPPCENADLLLASTHIDDEQLFFAGVLPYYAGELGLDVQVVYFTDPFKYHERPHEQLNGLWTVGVRHYPVCGAFVDEYSETAKDAYSHQKNYGFEREDMVLFQVKAIRRFKPHVVVGHDINGEYSHGQHIINCETLMEALPLAADATFDPDSAEKWGAWDTPKTYIHLWSENKIVMDWDIPLENFGGKTAFQVTQDGFACHKSQHWTWFYRWIYGKNKDITKATQIKTYSPCLYGLYRTEVGLDSGIGDMFENISASYGDIAKTEQLARIEAYEREYRERLEAERLEAERAESERLESIAASAGGYDDPDSDNDKTDNTGTTDVTDNNGSERRAVYPVVIIVIVAVAATVAITVIQLVKIRK